MHLQGQDILIDREVRMLALGDSYTIGESVEPEQRWPHQFASALRSKGLTVIDPDYIAITGWTTSNLLDGIEKNLDRGKSYNLVSILIGVNNQYQGIDINIYEPELRQILDRALDLVGQDTARIFMLSIPDYAFTPFGKGDAAISKGIDAYNSINSRVAREYGMVRVEITPISREGLSQPALVAEDGLHPSGRQYGEWITEILPNLLYH
jgi:lysophospholipase L1-like esterase